MGRPVCNLSLSAVDTGKNKRRELARARSFYMSPECGQSCKVTVQYSGVILLCSRTRPLSGGLCPFFPLFVPSFEAKDGKSKSRWANNSYSKTTTVTPLRESIVDKPPYTSGTLRLPTSFFSLFYKAYHKSNDARNS